MAESSEVGLPKMDIISEVTYIKLVLKTVKDMIRCLDLKVVTRLEFLTNLLVSRTTEELKVITKRIIEEYNLFKENIKEATETTKELLTKAQNEVKHPATSQDHLKKNISSSLVPLTASFLDGKRLTQNLDILLAMVEELKRENIELTEQNQTLTAEIMELTERTICKTKSKPYEKPIIQRKFSDESEISDEMPPYFKAMKGAIPMPQIRESMKMSVASVIEPERSFSHDFFQPCDASFIIDKSETLCLTRDDWKKALTRLRRDQETMTLAEMKLAGVKAAARVARHAIRK